MNPGTPTVTLRYWAGLREAAGTAEEQLRASTVADALAQAREAHGERFSSVLAVCSVVVDGDPVGRRDPASVALREGVLVDCLPPFAGG